MFATRNKRHRYERSKKLLGWRPLGLEGLGSFQSQVQSYNLSSFLLLVAMHLLLVAMHLLLVAMHLLLLAMHLLLLAMHLLLLAMQCYY